MQFKKIDEINHFGDAIFFWCIVDDIPKKYIDNATMMDENDCPCFYTCLIFDECGLHFNQQNGGEVYYIGTDGSPYYLENVVFTEDEAKTFYKGCFDVFIKYIPRDGDKILSVTGADTTFSGTDFGVAEDVDSEAIMIDDEECDYVWEKE